MDNSSWQGAAREKGQEGIDREGVPTLGIDRAGGTRRSEEEGRYRDAEEEMGKKGERASEREEREERVKREDW